MYVSFGLLGLFMLPMLPAVVENCAECTYPIQEDLSVGLLFIGKISIIVVLVVVIGSILLYCDVHNMYISSYLLPLSLHLHLHIQYIFI